MITLVLPHNGDVMGSVVSCDPDHVLSSIVLGDDLTIQAGPILQSSVSKCLCVYELKQICCRSAGSALHSKVRASVIL